MQTYEQNHSDISNWLSMQSKIVQKETSIVTSEDINQNFMLHIDKKSPKVFIPSMPRRASQTENNTCARVTVAPTLIGCLIAYASSDQDFRFGSTKFNMKENNFRGGYEINELEFTHCIKPSSKLVYDADQTGEHWLVNYNTDTTQYKCNMIGKFFIKSILSEAVTGNSPNSLLTLYIEQHKAGGIKFSPNIHLKEGYHKAVVSFKNEYERDVCSEKDFKVKEISEGEYKEAKGMSASMLSLQEKTPFTRW